MQLSGLSSPLSEADFVRDQSGSQGSIALRSLNYTIFLLWSLGLECSFKGQGPTGNPSLHTAVGRQAKAPGELQFPFKLDIVIQTCFSQKTNSYNLYRGFEKISNVTSSVYLVIYTCTSIGCFHLMKLFAIKTIRFYIAV